MDMQQFLGYLPQIVFLLAVIVMFVWIVILPAKQRERKHQRVIDDAKVGDKIITAGGMYGTLRRAGDKTVDVEIAEGVVITLDRRAIVRQQNRQQDRK